MKVLIHYNIIYNEHIGKHITCPKGHFIQLIGQKTIIFIAMYRGTCTQNTGFIYIHSLSRLNIICLLLQTYHVEAYLYCECITSSAMRTSY